MDVFPDGDTVSFLVSFLTMMNPYRGCHRSLLTWFIANFGICISRSILLPLMGKKTFKQFLSKNTRIFRTNGNLIYLKQFYHEKDECRLDKEEIEYERIQFYSNIMLQHGECVPMEISTLATNDTVLRLMPHRLCKYLYMSINYLELLFASHPELFTVNVEGNSKVKNGGSVMLNEFLFDEECVLDDEERLFEKIVDLKYINARAVNFYASTLTRISAYFKMSIMVLVRFRVLATKEVRAVAKNVGELKTFLQAYPNVFTVEGDYVMLTVFQINITLIDRVTDVIEFFTVILTKKICCDLYYLYKYLKNAPKKITVVIGNITQLKCFIYSHPDSFLIEGKFVLSAHQTIHNLRHFNRLKRIKTPAHVEEAVKFYSKILEKHSHELYSFSDLFGQRKHVPKNIHTLIQNISNLKQLIYQHPETFLVINGVIRLRGRWKTTRCSCSLPIELVDAEIISYFIDMLLKYGGSSEVPLVHLLTNKEQAPSSVCNVTNDLSQLESFLISHSKIFCVTNKTVVLKQFRNDNLEKLIERNQICKEEEYIEKQIPRKLNYVIDGLKNIQVIKLFEDVRTVSISPVKSFMGEINHSSDRESSFIISDSKEGSESLNETHFQGRIKNSTNEAVKFFFGKLCQYGTCHILSIDKLYSYKFPGPISENINTFRTFLKENPNDFIVTEDNVMAKINRRTAVSKSGSSSVNKSKPPTDLLFLFIQNYTQDKNNIHIEALCNDIRKYFSRTYESSMFSSLDHLVLFLSMFPDVFYVVENVINPIPQAPKRNSSPRNINLHKSMESFSKERLDFNIKVNRTELIENLDRCHQIAEIILENENVIALDCEGINLGKNGKLTLIQLGLSGVVYIFDVLKDKRLVIEGKLKDILESDYIIKVIHDCRNDSYNLYMEFGVTLRKVFDTRIAHYIINTYGKRKEVKKGSEKWIQTNQITNIGFNRLCKFYGAQVNNLRKNNMKNIYKNAECYWAKRPLNEDMLSYAAADVTCLLQVYYNILEKLKPEYEPLFWMWGSETVLASIKMANNKQT